MKWVLNPETDHWWYKEKVSSWKQRALAVSVALGQPEQEPASPPASHATSGHIWPLYKKESTIPISLGFCEY